MIHGKKAFSRRRRQNSGTNVPEFWRQRLETSLFPVGHLSLSCYTKYIPHITHVSLLKTAASIRGRSLTVGVVATFSHQIRVLTGISPVSVCISRKTLAARSLHTLRKMVYHLGVVIGLVENCENSEFKPSYSECSNMYLNFDDNDCILYLTLPIGSSFYSTFVLFYTGLY